MTRRVSVLLSLMLVLCMSVPVFAASVDAMTDDNTYIDEAGNVYTYQDDKVYKLVDGELYEVVNGSQQSIIDVMKEKPGSDVPDAEVMGEATGLVGSTIGVALSVIIYVFFAMTAFTTACDLTYIGVPAIRGFLYERPSGSANIHSSAMPGGAAGQYRDQNGLGNQDKVRREESVGSGGRCFISSELRSLVNAGQVGMPMMSNAFGGIGMPNQVANTNSNLILTYFKRRIVSIVLIVVVFMLLVTSTVFTDFGLNIGNMLYRYVTKFLGI